MRRHHVSVRGLSEGATQAADRFEWCAPTALDADERRTVVLRPTRTLVRVHAEPWEEAATVRQRRPRRYPPVSARGPTTWASAGPSYDAGFFFVTLLLGVCAGVGFCVGVAL